MSEKDGAYRLSRISGYIVAAVLILTVMGLPLGTLARMCIKHIPVSEYSENILGKYKMIGLNTRLTEWMSGGLYMESNEVLLGKEGWLFYKTDTDGEPLHDYMGINRFSDDELAAAYANLKNAADTIYMHDVIASGSGKDSQKIKLAVLTIPNKEQVYAEYMPDTVEKISDTSRLMQLTDYVSTRGLKPMIMDSYVPLWTYTDVSDLLICAHEDYPLYYKTDTHWTDEGAYLALTAVMRSLDGEADTPEGLIEGSAFEQVEFSVEPGFVGDLTKISATQDRFPDVTYKINGDTIPDEYKTNKKLLIVGDSFGDSLQHVAVYCFSEVRFLDIKEYNDKFEETLDSYDPDLVILECVERYLPRLTELNADK